MHNPTRRVKRFRRPPSRTLNQLSKASSPNVDVPSQDTPNDGRHRRTAHPDALRGAMLVALIVVTIVLYIVLWELERSSSLSVPEPSLDRSAIAASQSSGNPKGTSTPAIVQDGPLLRSGDALNLSDGRAAVSPSYPGHAPRPAWPPLITRVPDEHTDDLVEKADHRVHENGSTAFSALFDAAYCDGPCRFLLPVRVGEQESKARLHFTQLLTLAQRLNRTLVFPNVGKSRMSVCSKWPFGAYYDTSALAHPGAPPGFSLAMDLDAFAKWIDERPVPPSSFVVSMHAVHKDRWRALEAQADSEDGPYIVEKAEVDPKVLSCFDTKLPRLRSSLPRTALSISLPSGPHEAAPDVSTRLVQLLSQSPDINTDSDSDFDLMTGSGYDYPPPFSNTSRSLADTNLLVVDYDLRYPLFTASTHLNFNLHYAPVLYDLADRLSDNLGLFLGVHWRMENVPVQNLAWCAASLVSTLHGLLQDDVMGKNVRHVWLATDYTRPLTTDGGRTANGIRSGDDGAPLLPDYSPPKKSSTFNALTSEHDNAIGTITEAFQPGGDLDAWNLTDLAEQLRLYPYVEGKFDVNEASLDDPGVFGILDKLVVVQAKVFVSGTQDCSKISSFSKQIIEARRESLEADRGRDAMRNVVEYFGRW